MDAITSSKGYAGVARNVRNRLYSRAAAKCMESATAISLSWDGATYGGLNVNIAMAVDCMRKRACYLRPGVGTTKTKLSVAQVGRLSAQAEEKIHQFASTLESNR